MIDTQQGSASEHQCPKGWSTLSKSLSIYILHTPYGTYSIEQGVGWSFHIEVERKIIYLTNVVDNMLTLDQLAEACIQDLIAKVDRITEVIDSTCEVSSKVHSEELPRSRYVRGL